MDTLRDRANVSARVRLVMREHEHPEMTPARVEAMGNAAKLTFADALDARGIDATQFELFIHLDELVGPMAFVARTDESAQSWTLAGFQVWLSRD